VTLSDGAVRNGYTLKIANKLRTTDQLTLVLESAAPLTLLVQEAEALGPNRVRVSTRPDGITEWRALVTRAADARPAANTPITFRLLDPTGATILTERTSFMGPQ
jgi:hypothetical protein